MFGCTYSVQSAKTTSTVRNAIEGKAGKGSEKVNKKRARTREASFVAFSSASHNDRDIVAARRRAECYLLK